MIRIAKIFAILALCMAGIFAQAGETASKTVLFVCQFGSVKSAITRELFRRRAGETGVAVTAISRGITPQAHSDPALAAKLAKESVDPARDPLQGLDRATLQHADIVVFFDKLPLGLSRADARDWSDLPSMIGDYDAARTMLDTRIDALLAEIGK